jgi:hypothetical protein
MWSTARRNASVPVATSCSGRGTTVPSGRKPPSVTRAVGVEGGAEQLDWGAGGGVFGGAHVAEDIGRDEGGQDRDHDDHDQVSLGEGWRKWWYEGSA